MSKLKTKIKTNIAEKIALFGLNLHPEKQITTITPIPDPENIFSRIDAKAINEAILNAIPKEDISGIQKEVSKFLSILTPVLVAIRDKRPAYANTKLELSPSTYGYYLDAEHLNTLILDKHFTDHTKALKKFLTKEGFVSGFNDADTAVFNDIAAIIKIGLGELEKDYSDEYQRHRFQKPQRQDLELDGLEFKGLLMDGANTSLINLGNRPITPLDRKTISNLKLNQVIIAFQSGFSSYKDCLINDSLLDFCSIAECHFEGVVIKDTIIKRSSFSNIDFDQITIEGNVMFIDCYFHDCTIKNHPSLFINCRFAYCDTSNLMTIKTVQPNSKDTAQVSDALLPSQNSY